MRSDAGGCAVLCCAVCLDVLQVDPASLSPDSLGSVHFPLDHPALVTYTPTEQDKVVSAGHALFWNGGGGGAGVWPWCCGVEYVSVGWTAPRAHCMCAHST